MVRKTRPHTQRNSVARIFEIYTRDAEKRSPLDERFCIFARMNRLLSLILLLGLGIAFSSETADGLRRQIKTVNEETVREKKLHAEERERHEAFVRSGREKVVLLSNQKKTLRAEIDSMKAELSRLSDARNKSAGVIRFYESRKQKYAQDLAQEIENLIPGIETDFPYRTSQAVENLRETASELRKGFISPDDALSRTMEVLLERIRMGYTTESWDGFLSDPETGREYSGKFFRFGAVAAMFESRDGNACFWLRHSGENFHWTKVPEDLEFRASVKDAMKVAEGKTAPHIVRIPVSAPNRED